MDVGALPACIIQRAPQGCSLDVLRLTAAHAVCSHKGVVELQVGSSRVYTHFTTSEQVDMAPVSRRRPINPSITQSIRYIVQANEKLNERLDLPIINTLQAKEGELHARTILPLLRRRHRRRSLQQRPLPPLRRIRHIRHTHQSRLHRIVRHLRLHRLAAGLHILQHARPPAASLRDTSQKMEEEQSTDHSCVAAIHTVCGRLRGRRVGCRTTRGHTTQRNMPRPRRRRQV